MKSRASPVLLPHCTVRQVSTKWSEQSGSRAGSNTPIIVRMSLQGWAGCGAVTFPWCGASELHGHPNVAYGIFRHKLPGMTRDFFCSIKPGEASNPKKFYLRRQTFLLQTGSGSSYTSGGRFWQNSSGYSRTPSCFSIKAQYQLLSPLRVTHLYCSGWSDLKISFWGSKCSEKGPYLARYWICE